MLSRFQNCLLHVCSTILLVKYNYSKFKILFLSPGQRGSVGCASSCALKGCGLGPPRGMQEAANGYSALT